VLNLAHHSSEKRGMTKKASSLSFQAAVLVVVVGMAWGIVMAISQDHSAMPAHAHLNLLGWVSLLLIGIFYYLHPIIDHSQIAIVQVWIWIAATQTSETVMTRTSQR
jgi:cbb3-type cytochrome oxidase subunit 1